ncbi:reactive intermediate/imine deaminase [Candidatus Kuenenbacteria bacterium]|nr:reactive intermediate/imine deaminase [Candidatus Kuenenbacteria bacterium]
MKKISISSDQAPKAAGFFSQAILTSCDFRLELSGQIGLDPKSGKIVEGGIAEQTEQIFNNLEGILSELGWTFCNINKVRIFLVSMDDYQAMNEVYSKRFTDTPPARVAVAVKELPLGALVEMECTAEGNTMSDEAKKKYKI